MSARCRSCGAPIVWATTEKGRKMPLDAHPTYGFRLIEGAAGSIIAKSAAVHVSHFATCPDADEHRRRDKS